MLTTQSALAKDLRNASAAPALQHRHYAVIAGIIAKVPPRMRSATARHFADQLTTTNPRFDRDRFLRACNTTATLEDLEPYLAEGG